METHFLNPEREDNSTVQNRMKMVAEHPMVRQMLEAAGCAMVILNEYRQLLAWNSRYLEVAGVKDLEAALGLRLGEALRCVNSHVEPGGCGTAKQCRSCGAALALAATLQSGESHEEICVLEARPTERAPLSTRYFKVLSRELRLEGERYLLLLLLDNTNEQSLAQLHRMFFHDLSNLLMGIVANAELLALRPSLAGDPSFTLLQDTSRRIAREVSMQQALSGGNLDQLQKMEETISIRAFLSNLDSLWTVHPVARNRELRIRSDVSDLNFLSDGFILQRVLGNMVCNAFEATAEGETVEVRVLTPGNGGGNTLRFEVQNRGEIPVLYRGRIFQRYFTTKKREGRGLGTWSMRVLGQDVLGGRVGFESGRGETIFWLELSYRPTNH